jgi:hypothetical protein
MAKFDMLVHLRSHEGESLAASVALTLARRLDAYVYGLYVAPMGSVAFSTPETVVFQVHEADHLYDEARAQGGWWKSLLDRTALPASGSSRRANRSRRFATRRAGAISSWRSGRCSIPTRR